MVALNSVLIRAAGECLSYDEAVRLALLASKRPDAQTVLVDLRQVCRATTGGLARLVVLRRELLESGRDIRLLGLHGRAEYLYQTYRMENLLPREQASENLRWREPQETSAAG